MGGLSSRYDPPELLCILMAVRWRGGSRSGSGSGSGSYSRLGLATSSSRFRSLSFGVVRTPYRPPGREAAKAVAGCSRTGSCTGFAVPSNKNCGGFQFLVVQEPFTCGVIAAFIIFTGLHQQLLTHNLLWKIFPWSRRFRNAEWFTICTTEFSIHFCQYIITLTRVRGHPVPTRVRKFFRQVSLKVTLRLFRRISSLASASTFSFLLSFSGASCSSSCFASSPAPRSRPPLSFLFLPLSFFPFLHLALFPLLQLFLFFLLQHRTDSSNTHVDLFSSSSSQPTSSSTDISLNILD